MTAHTSLHLFDAYGVELEYMIVNRRTLDVMPIADELIRAVAGEYVSDVDRGDISWSNELVLHVIELKTNGPTRNLDALASRFQEEVRAVNALLEPMGACLMPTAAHPWMDPHGETRLWPHEYNAVYESYNRVFDCRGHGWSNLQSTHLNLPFCGDEEFGRLHAAIRLVLPLLPAIAASSPIIELRATGHLDTRLDCYRRNSAKIPSITGDVIPEPVYTQADYEREILQRAYRDIAPHDPDGVLQEEFLNSRGAIARFGRGSIEIRLLDIQESPCCDLAIVRSIAGVLRSLTSETPGAIAAQMHVPTKLLKGVLDDAIRNGGEASLDPTRHGVYTDALGIDGGTTLREAWRQLLARNAKGRELLESAPLRAILDRPRGTLAARILDTLGPGTTWPRDKVTGVYRQLCDALQAGDVFRP